MKTSNLKKNFIAVKNYKSLKILIEIYRSKVIKKNWYKNSK